MSRPNGAADAAADSEPVRDEDLEPEAEPQTVTVEHEGQTYELPAALQGALMRQAYYARKTQALAQMQGALVAGHQDLAAQKQAQADHLGEHARLAGLDDGIARLQQLNWPVLQQQNPAQAQQLMTQLFQMRQAREIAAGHLAHKQSVLAFQRQRQHAAQVEHAHAVAARDIEGWSSGRRGRLAQYALGQGITGPELGSIADPRLIKILHHACAHDDVQQQKSAGQRLTKAQAVRPAIQVGGTGGAPKDPNRMSTDDWMRHRRGQLRTKAR